ncbi:MAG: imidazole glycerol phosphate synthase subunit HisH [Candidatus Poribacteria bacterium]|nr:imidazole glycerol phosphate synthase subunit HisH [Candidatus Poribacteria bacterium]
MIAVIDYGMGNLRSVQKGLEHVGANAVITDDPNVLREANAIVLPGQGAFGAAMNRLDEAGMTQAVKDEIASGKPFLGICIGIQLLFESSEEAPGVAGLGILPGTVTKFRPERLAEGQKVPHMGWNELSLKQSIPHFSDVKNGDYVYFVHSYYPDPSDTSVIAATTDYGVEFASAVAYENVVATQFHPEKSQRVGLSILRAFAELVA